MSQDPMQQFHTNYQTPIQNSWSAPMPWQSWSPPLAQSAPNWRGYAHGDPLLHFDKKSDGYHVGFSTLPCRMNDTLIFFNRRKLFVGDPTPR